jgi:cystathionine beta-lyase/cystathionine gamma-synthase
MVNDLSLYEKIKDLQIVLGGVPSPFDCFLVCRSLKTFPIRMEKHQLNGIKVATALENNPRVDKVIYPGNFHLTLLYHSLSKKFENFLKGLKSHAQHELFKKQMTGYGGMMSFYIKSDVEGTKKFLKALKVHIKLVVC